MPPDAAMPSADGSDAAVRFRGVPDGTCYVQSFGNAICSYAHFYSFRLLSGWSARYDRNAWSVTLVWQCVFRSLVVRYM